MLFTLLIDGKYLISKIYKYMEMYAKLLKYMTWAGCSLSDYFINKKWIIDYS